MLAVSGGVDSMVLLHLLAQRHQSPVTSHQSLAVQTRGHPIDYRLSTIGSTSSIELVVAHFNHGIRQEAKEDEALVRNAARQLGLSFECGRTNLGRGASEEAARKARYNFLFDVQKNHEAQAIITAHHQDDLIETAFINLLRGTGRKGLTAIQDNKKVLRPLLKYSKADILYYAKANKLTWHEDPTNADKTYLRNYIRHSLLKGLTDEQRCEILENIKKVAKTNVNIDDSIAKLSQSIYRNDRINRYAFNNLPVILGNELMAFWLRCLNVRVIDKKTVGRLSLALKTSKPNTICPVQGSIKLFIGQKTANFSSTL